MADAATRKIGDPKVTLQQQQSFEDQLKAIRQADQQRKRLWGARQTTLAKFL